MKHGEFMEPKKNVDFVDFITSTKGLLIIIIGFLTLIAIMMTLSVLIIRMMQSGKPPLQAPTIIYENRFIKWNYVAEAETYIIYVNGSEHDTTAYNQYSVRNLSDGQYTIEVAAKKGEEVSPRSNSLTVVVDND